MKKAMPVSLLTTLGIVATMVPASSAEAAVQPLPADRQTIRTQLLTNPENTNAEIDAAFAAYDKGDSSLLEALPFHNFLELKGGKTGTQAATTLAAACDPPGVYSVHSYWVKMWSDNIFGVEILWSRYDVKWRSNGCALVNGLPSESSDSDSTGSAGLAGWDRGTLNLWQSYFFDWNGNPFGGWHHDQTYKFENAECCFNPIYHEMHVNILGSARVCVSFKDGTGLQCGQY
jgi:hypothetical protein